MTESITASYSYTVVDVRNVLASFAADYDMIRASTNLVTDDETADAIVADVTAFAEHELIDSVDIVLQDRFGSTLRAAHYEPSTDATGWQVDRPGGCIWPRTPDGELIVVVRYSRAWTDLGPAGQQRFVRDHLERTWKPSGIDLTHPGLSASPDRRYASNGYGLYRTSYA